MGAQMNLEWFKKKRVTVMGLGFHGGGVGMVEWLCKLGAEVTVTDFGDEHKLELSLARIRNLPVRLVLGRHEESDFVNADCVIRNPAIPNESPFLKLAKKHGVPVEMESSLFFRFCPTRNIVAVTGTKGKSSTTHMIAMLLNESGYPAKLAGNMGLSMVGLLDKITAEDWLVLELSSFQCEGFVNHQEEFRINGLGPKYAILTNLFEDHLNRYKDMFAYAAAKKLLFEIQNGSQVSIFRKNDLWREFFVEKLQSRVVLAEPEDNWPWTAEKYPHLGNVDLAWALAQELGISKEKFVEALNAFEPLAHRLEFVRNYNGVKFINDSTATNPTAAVRDVELLLKSNDRLVLIIGGNDKEMDFKDFVRIIEQNRIYYVLLQGTADKKLENLPAELSLGRYKLFNDAVRAAYTKAREFGGTVALVPGATSFNMFKDEFDRGDKFKKIVMEL
jgi:UDP-N-acetylmuramoylalanine--D-glutamate ligase